jgi:uncharacterized protein (TIGR02118 family)
MPTSITVLYPNVDDATFDMSYYTSSHMRMVAEEFKEFGFKGQSVYTWRRSGVAPSPCPSSASV